MTMNVIYKNKLLAQVKSFEEASSVVFAYTRGKSGRSFSHAVVTSLKGKSLARVSYNGRVWEDEDWTSDTKCLYDPYGRNGN